MNGSPRAPEKLIVPCLFANAPDLPNPQTVLIVDNVAEPEMLASANALSAARFAPLELNCNLLFTTPTNFSLPGVAPQSIDVLSPEAALDLLNRSMARPYGRRSRNTA